MYVCVCLHLDVEFVFSSFPLTLPHISLSSLYSLPLSLSLSVSLQVQVGNFRRIIAKVQLGGSELAITISIVVCCVLLLLCTVGKYLERMPGVMDAWMPWRRMLQM